jgi:hypothetical protein
LYADIWMPYPHKITSIEPTNTDGKLRGGAVGQLSSSTLSLLQVFTYIFDHEGLLRLKPHPWRPKAAKDKPNQDQRVGGFVSLHLFAEPDTEMSGPGHFNHAFPVAIQMFNQVDLQLKDEIKAPGAIRVADIPFGTRLEEMEDLDVRNSRLAFLGVLLKRGQSLNQAFLDTSFTDATDAERCAGMIGG